MRELDGGGEVDLLGFRWEDWFDRLRAAEGQPELGTLGSYRVLGEVGRGGQGVVFRARQPGTGREVALKRLLDGSFASAAALRRFEREVEAAASLSHPGIVAVFGFELVDGAPLLAMEWVDGQPLTRWADGRAHGEVLAQFLLVCDAVQHAHQRGVLHRDLKPSNVLVDREGRPRVLDFGLAKRTADASSAAITASGEFLGTPGYAAPEQWRGEELDVRGDVFALGALLFEMLTGRRLIEGDALAAMSKALAHEPAPRPSSLVPGLPRELDDVVLQATASEREARYQSVDALSADLRRFQRGEPVLAHPPGTAYLLRKLVARNRLATASIVVLVVASAVYAFAANRSGRLLGEERDRAVLAGAREKEAHQQAEAALARTDAALEETQRARDKAEALLAFFTEDVIGSVDPDAVGHDPKLIDVLRIAAEKAKARFAQTPDAEAQMHLMLGHAFGVLGEYADAEREHRAGLAGLGPDAPLVSTSPATCSLAEDVLELGRFDEAEAILAAHIQRFEALPADEAAAPAARNEWASALNVLARSYSMRELPGRAVESRKRALDLVVDPDFARDIRANLAQDLRILGHLDEAIAIQREDLAQLIELGGEDQQDTAFARQNLASSLIMLRRPAEAEQQLRRALETLRKLLGPDHVRVAGVETTLALALVDLGMEYDEAEALARHASTVAEARAPGGQNAYDAAYALASVLEGRRNPTEALPLYQRANADIEKVTGARGAQWINTAQSVVRCLVKLDRPAEAQEWIDRLTASATPPSAPWTLLWQGHVLHARGDLEATATWFEEGLLTADPRGPEGFIVPSAMGVYARTLRELGLPEEAADVERRKAELDRELGVRRPKFEPQKQ